MKKIMYLFLYFIFAYASFGKYDFPEKNPYAATILGSTTAMTDFALPEKIPTKEYTLTLQPAASVPDNLWFHKKFKFSLAYQKYPAPLVFILAGTGSSHNSGRMDIFQKILYSAGFNVICMSSPLSQNFIVSASSTRLPGMMMDDCKDLYNVMKLAYEKVKDKIDVTEFNLTGYSLGATESAFISYIDESEKYFDFKKVYMINPAVDLYESAIILDSFLGSGKEAGPRIARMLDYALEKGVYTFGDEYEGFTATNIYGIFKKAKLTNDQMKYIIGLVFRITSIDLNYTTDALNKSGVYSKRPVKKFDSMFKYFEKVNFASFEDYLTKIVYPTLKAKKGWTFADIRKNTSLELLTDYLKKTDKIVAVTNQDELILTPKHLDYLKKTFGDRLIVFPEGGHCGNMYYTPNVEIMIRYLSEGVFKFEN